MDLTASQRAQLMPPPAPPAFPSPFPVSHSPPPFASTSHPLDSEVGTALAATLTSTRPAKRLNNNWEGFNHSGKRLRFVAVRLPRNCRQRRLPSDGKSSRDNSDESSSSSSARSTPSAPGDSAPKAAKAAIYHVDSQPCHHHLSAAKGEKYACNNPQCSEVYCAACLVEFYSGLVVIPRSSFAGASTSTAEDGTAAQDEGKINCPVCWGFCVCYRCCTERGDVEGAKAARQKLHEANVRSRQIAEREFLSNNKKASSSPRRKDTAENRRIQRSRSRTKSVTFDLPPIDESTTEVEVEWDEQHYQQPSTSGASPRLKMLLASPSPSTAEPIPHGTPTHEHAEIASSPSSGYSGFEEDLHYSRLQVVPKVEEAEDPYALPPPRVSTTPTPALPPNEETSTSMVEDSEDEVVFVEERTQDPPPKQVLVQKVPSPARKLASSSSTSRLLGRVNPAVAARTRRKSTTTSVTPTMDEGRVTTASTQLQQRMVTPPPSPAKASTISPSTSGGLKLRITLASPVRKTTTVLPALPENAAAISLARSRLLGLSQEEDTEVEVDVKPLDRADFKRMQREGEQERRRAEKGKMKASSSAPSLSAAASVQQGSSSSPAQVKPRKTLPTLKEKKAQNALKAAQGPVAKRLRMPSRLSAPSLPNAAAKRGNLPARSGTGSEDEEEEEEEEEWKPNDQALSGTREKGSKRKRTMSLRASEALAAHTSSPRNAAASTSKGPVASTSKSKGKARASSFSSLPEQLAGSTATQTDGAPGLYLSPDGALHLTRGGGQGPVLCLPERQEVVWHEGPERRRRRRATMGDATEGEDSMVIDHLGESQTSLTASGSGTPREPATPGDLISASSQSTSASRLTTPPPPMAIRTPSSKDDDFLVLLHSDSEDDFALGGYDDNDRDATPGLVNDDSSRRRRNRKKTSASSSLSGTSAGVPQTPPATVGALSVAESVYVNSAHRGFLNPLAMAGCGSDALLFPDVLLAGNGVGMLGMGRGDSPAAWWRSGSPSVGEVTDWSDGGKKGFGSSGTLALTERGLSSLDGAKSGGAGSQMDFGELALDLDGHHGVVVGGSSSSQVKELLSAVGDDDDDDLRLVAGFGTPAMLRTKPLRDAMEEEESNPSRDSMSLDLEEEQEGPAFLVF